MSEKFDILNKKVVELNTKLATTYREKYKFTAIKITLINTQNEYKKLNNPFNLGKAS